MPGGWRCCSPCRTLTSLLRQLYSDHSTLLCTGPDPSKESASSDASHSLNGTSDSSFRKKATVSLICSFLCCILCTMTDWGLNVYQGVELLRHYESQTSNVGYDTQNGVKDSACPCSSRDLGADGMGKATWLTRTRLRSSLSVNTCITGYHTFIFFGHISSTWKPVSFVHENGSLSKINK